MGAPTWRTSPAASVRWWIGPGVLTVRIDAPLTRVDAARMRLLLPRLLACSGAAVVVCDLRCVREPDLSIVEAVARVRLVAAQLGQRVHVLGGSAHLQRLCALVGLPDLAPAGGPTAVVCGRSLLGFEAVNRGRRTGSGTAAPVRAVPTPPG